MQTLDDILASRSIRPSVALQALEFHGVDIEAGDLANLDLEAYRRALHRLSMFRRCLYRDPAERKSVSIRFRTAKPESDAGKLFDIHRVSIVSLCGFTKTRSGLQLRTYPS